MAIANKNALDLVPENSSERGVPQNGAQSEADERRDRPPWQVFIVFLMTTILILFFYGSSVDSPSLLLVELLIASAAISLGSFLGFLFGMPRAVIAASTTEENDAEAPLSYRPSTNLEQVSDWLTKILIGVGLVELRHIGGTLASMGHVVAGSLKNPPPGTEVVTQVVVVAFSVFGFIAGFLWTRIYYGPLQTLTDQSLISRLRSSLKKFENKLSNQESDIQSVRKVTEGLATGKLVTQRTAVSRELPASIENEAAQDTLPEEVRNKLADFQEHEPDWDSDPGADLFPNAPQEAHGRRLEAELVEKYESSLVIDLRVRRLGGEPLGDEVIFLLHPTFDDSILYKKPENEIAEVEILALGWFTAVAILDGGRTVLSYKLRNLPGAPDWFKED